MATRYTLLVFGFINKEEECINTLSTVIPDSVKSIILLFYPKECTIYRNHAPTFTKLKTLCNVFCNDIHRGMVQFILKSVSNRIYVRGNNYKQQCGITYNDDDKFIDKFTEIELT